MNNIFLIKKFLWLILLTGTTVGFCQKPDPMWPVKANRFFQGFEVKVSGEVLDFLPGLTNGQVALLVRATNGKSALEFHSEIIPLNYTEEFVSLIWSTAIARKAQDIPGSFSLLINDKPFFTFYTHADSLSPSWTLKNDKAELSFVSTEISKPSQDAFGYMFLNIPTSLIKNGERVSIKVIGSNSNSMDWYMPFGIPVTNEQTILAEPALIKTKGGLMQRIRVELKHAGSPTNVQFKLDAKVVQTAALKPGKKVFYLLHDPVDVDQQVSLEIGIAGKPKSLHSVVLHPVRKFEVYFLAHSHVDIGFTHKQDEVEKLQWRNFELGIELAEKTKDYPEGSRFKWNAEITWAIEGYLKNASEDKKKRFIDAVNKGWIGLDALYGSQLTGLQREEEMINNQRYANQLESKYNFDITAAMISDVPGYSWGSVESLAQSGVKYFSSGPNHMPHLPHGGYQVGHTFEAWGDVPFYWASASGKQKVLFWMTSHGYSWFHNWSVDILSKAGGDPIVKFLDELEKQKYPYDLVQLRYTVGNDNGPPDETMPDFIRQWNETYAYPKMRIATTREMMEDFEKRYGAQLPTYKGDFTPYWEDGAASSALETGINRKTADRLVQAETLSAMVNASGNTKERFDDAWRNVVLFSEHTWGANISKSQPDSEFTKSLWDVKQAFALDAEKQSTSLINDALSVMGSTNKTAEAFQVVNTTSWPRTNLVTVPASWNLSTDYITDESGKSINSQVLSSGELVFVAENVPALGSKKYLIKKGKRKADPLMKPTTDSIYNEKVSVSFDKTNGDIASIRMKNGPNLIDDKDTLGFNAYWYGGLYKDNLAKQTKAKFEIIENGTVVTRIRVTSDAPGAESLVREVQLVNGLDEIFILNTVDKERVITDENVRFTFPFKIQNSQVRIDIPWATMRPETDQLKGANKNFYSVQRWVDISNSERGVTLAPLEAPLLEIGDMNGQKWMTDKKISPWIRKYEPSTRLFSWVMNNAWFVNYKAFQEGKIPFHYVLKPHAAFNDFQTKKFGIEQTQPLLAVPTSKEVKTIVPIFKLTENSTVLITSLKESADGKAMIIRFFNPTEKPTIAEIKWEKIKPTTIYQSNPQEEKVTPAGNSISLSPWEVITLRAEYR